MDIKELLNEMVRLDASDIYLIAGLPPTYRVEGKTASSSGDALKPEDTENIAISIMSETQ